jgi:hypothetical protein
MGTGQANVKTYNRHLCKLIHEGRAKPSFIVSHELGLEDAPEAYEHFDAREDGWTKVVLKPGNRAAKHATGHTHANGHARSHRSSQSGAAT